MGTAELISSASHAKRKKVGAIIVKDNRIISTGYNGTPSGFDNECEINDVTKLEVLHAESNAIAKCAKSNESTEGSIMYVTLAPCFNCSKLIIQCGINQVFYKEDYTNDEGLKLLKKANINVTKI
jgi:dCMP deaminase